MLKPGLFARVILASSIAAVSAAGIFAQPSAYRISEPHVHKNLTIFLIHGKDEDKKGNMLTLREAMERKLFIVYETSDVNLLEVENLSKEFDVFIQSGDIVKGGKQDRVLAVSIVIPARSGRVRIESYCVESGRWSKRGAEDTSRFSSANDRIVTKELKIAANSTRSQQEVWRQVSDAQARLERNVGAPVADAESRSSLQLSLENKRLAASIDEYIKALAAIAANKRDVIGYAFAINGKINSADIYSSNALFRKLWPQMLRSMATEAVAELRGVRLAVPEKADAVDKLIRDSERARSVERSAGENGRIVTREDKDTMMIEARDDRTKTVVHKSYLRKN